MPTSSPSTPKTSFFYACAAYVAWGVFPLYFKALRTVDAPEILAHRIVWSATLLALLVTATGRWREYRLAFATWQSIGTYALSTALVTVNWLIYIWAVLHGRVLEASLGYFITPLVNVLLGILFLGEGLQRRQAWAVAVAATGVLVLVLRVGTLPWVALALAASFGSYGLVRKKARIDPTVGLLVETSVVAPLAAGLILFRAAAGSGALGSDARTSALLVFAGVITAAPLIWFAHGVRNLRLSTMGLLQFISPTLQFLCAVLLFGETFTRAHAIAFVCIWTSVAIYSFDLVARFGAKRTTTIA